MQDYNSTPFKQADDTPEPSKMGGGFCLAESPLNEGFCYNLYACLLKRFNNYRRNRKQLFSEVILPSAFMWFGIHIANLEYIFRSPSKILAPDAYPLGQKILVNSVPIDAEGSNVDIRELMAKMPEAEQSF